MFVNVQYRLLVLVTMDFYSPDGGGCGVWCRYGVVFRGLRENTVTLEVLGNTKTFSRLQVLEFDSGQYCVVKNIQEVVQNI